MIYVKAIGRISNSSDIPVFYGQHDAYLSTQGGFIVQLADSDTESIRAFQKTEPELIPFDCARLSGSLDFWNSVEEDIYTSEDGQQI